MAGNIWEWTAEMTNAKYGTDEQTRDYAVIRGGSCNNVGSTNPVVRSEGDHYVTDCTVLVGFRPVLYVK